jgi:hypothetical protein
MRDKFHQLKTTENRFSCSISQSIHESCMNCIAREINMCNVDDCLEKSFSSTIISFILSLFEDYTIHDHREIKYDLYVVCLIHDRSLMTISIERVCLSSNQIDVSSC